MRIKRLLTIAILALVACASAFATYYDNGSQRFVISAGAEFPITVTDFKENKTKFGFGEGNTNMTLGGFGAISYQVFLTKYIAIGGEIGYMFNYCIDDSLLTNVPFLFKATYIPLQGTFEIPISLGVGISYLSLSDGGAYIPFFISGEIGFDWYFSEHWGIGVKSGMWMVAEVYYTSKAKDKNALATFAPVSLAVTYRQ